MWRSYNHLLNFLVRSINLFGIDLEFKKIDPFHIKKLFNTIRPFRKVKIPGLDLIMVLDHRESLDMSYKIGKLDFDVLDFISKNSSRDSHFVDVGSNQGLFSLFALQKNSLVLAIEPDPYSIDKLLTNISLNFEECKNFQLVEKAAGDFFGELPLMVNTAGNRAGSSLIHDQRRWTNKAENFEIIVEVCPLYDLLKDADVKKISILKLDIEGYESIVLRNFLEKKDNPYLPQHFIIEELPKEISGWKESGIEMLIRCGYRLVNHNAPNYFFSKR